jgi:hypothetical protein
MGSIVNLSFLFLINFTFLLILFICMLDLFLSWIYNLCWIYRFIVIDLNFSWYLSLFSYNSSPVFTLIFCMNFFLEAGIFWRINFMFFK